MRIIVEFSMKFVIGVKIVIALIKDSAFFEGKKYRKKNCRNLKKKARAKSMIWKDTFVRCPKCDSKLKYRITEPEESGLWIYKCDKCGWIGYDWELRKHT